VNTTEQDQISHDEYVPSADEFAEQRAGWRASLGDDEALRADAIRLQLAAEQHRYTYTWEWAGVPVIRLPDDIMVLQELFWSYRPQRVIETGVARGGSMLLNASLMRLYGATPAVLGIDLKVFEHTRIALRDHALATGVTLVEADSTSEKAIEATREFIAGAERVVLVLDSDHTHEHVLGELRALATLLPLGSYVLVADTLIEEFPQGHFANRPWDRGNNPLTAARAFLAETLDYDLDIQWSRRSLMSEFRDGILVRVSPGGAP
jgi:cephalosporin hydroxylase